MCLTSVFIAFGIYMSQESGCPHASNMYLSYNSKNQDIEITLKIKNGPSSICVLNYGLVEGFFDRQNETYIYSLTQVIKKMPKTDLEIISLDGKYETRISHKRIMELFKVLNLKSQL
jgi:hypothetical protein